MQIKDKKDLNQYKGWGQSKKTIQQIGEQFFHFIEKIMVKGESKRIREKLKNYEGYKTKVLFFITVPEYR